MKIGVFGATGKTGIQILIQGLELGHEFKVLARNPAAITNQFGDKVTVIEGNVLNQESVDKTIEGMDLVIVTLGNSSLGADTVCSQGQVVINSSVKSHQSVKRMVVITSLGVNESYDVCTLLKNPIADKCIQENSIRETFGKDSTADYIILRPGGLLDTPKTEKVLAKETGIGGGRISRADVAYFLLKHTLMGDTYANKAITLVSG